MSRGNLGKFPLDTVTPLWYTEDMKMNELLSAIDLKILERAILSYDTDQRRDLYRNGLIVRAEFVKDMDKRYRWDLFWTAWGQYSTVRDILSEVDFIDSHMDTFLRRIVSPL